MVKLRKWGQEIGSADYITGPLPSAPDAAKQALGRRFVLTSFESEGLRGLIVSVNANSSGPAICNWLRVNLLDGRDTQEVLRSLLTNLTLDINSTPLVTFLADFQLITEEITPVLPHREKCLTYAQKFPAEVLSIISVCDTNPGMADFMAYALAVNSKVNLFVQRLGLASKNRDSRRLPALATTIEKTSMPPCADPHAQLDAVQHFIGDTAMASSFEGDAANQLAVMLANMDSTLVQEALSTYFSSSSSRNAQRTRTPSSRSSIPKNRCVNCDEDGHLARNCTKPPAKCPHPICKRKGYDRHLSKYCLYAHPQLCWNEGMRKRITDELNRHGSTEAHATSDEYEDEFEEIFGFSFPSHSVSVLHSDTLHFGDSMLLMTVDAFTATIRQAIMCFTQRYSTRRPLYYAILFQLVVEYLIRWCRRSSHPLMGPTLASLRSADYTCVPRGNSC